ncbi:unnamed protein product [Rotaria magnacalcarata]|uniref:Uncharacterized protein n=2 Tax=Rotaria magnacalcarata TaxID=392030 RepID=A0A816Z5L1_9BILA|nr:unnamed protein product [Rotaria magnacalcarata]
MCQNQLSYGKLCNSSSWCRQDCNLTCVFRSCQPNTAICKLDSTAVTFDDIPNLNSLQGAIPSVYNNISWTNAQYLNATASVSSDYKYVCSSGQMVCWLNVPMTMQTSIANTTCTINSFVIAASWSNYITVTIVGYFTSTQIYTTTVAINTYTKQIMELN